MGADVFLCTDMDRTILPNGPQPESPQARERLSQVASHEEVTLAYVTGRNRELVESGIRKFQVPQPEYVIGDVGTTIYRIGSDGWEPLEDWSHEISQDWQNVTREDLADQLKDITSLQLQEPDRQGRFKLSYYTSSHVDRDTLLELVRSRLMWRGVNASLIWSIDEERDLGLLDILPKHATKLHAIRFLMQKRGFDEERTVFAGDSGNDLPALTSELQAVLVRNAPEEVRMEALRRSREARRTDKLYLASGDFLGMNGNYAAGVLEGLAHFIPDTGDWMNRPTHTSVGGASRN
jgi:sucrose-6F-phosphate phosphohydrolase